MEIKSTATHKGHLEGLAAEPMVTMNAAITRMMRTVSMSKSYPYAA